MLEGLKHLISLDRPATEILRDVLDILIVAFLLYRAMLVLRGTRAMQMGLGVMAFGVLYLVAKHAELATLMSVLSWLVSSAILIVVVVFQNDIRRALIRLGSKAWLSRGRAAQERVVDEVVAAATELARHRMGALMCLERDANVLEFVKNDGIHLDSMVTRDLLVSLFIPESVNKTHDGAVLIRDLRIARAGVFFPMPESDKIGDPTLGSRHRAAIGITEETDAVVVVVSEERGTITLCFPNGMVPNVDATSLKHALLGLLGGLAGAKPARFMSRMRAGLRRAARRTEPEAATAEPASAKTERSAKTPTVDKVVSAAAKPGADKAGAAATSSSRTPSSGKLTPAPSKVKEVLGRAEAEATKTPLPPRVSVPMPTGKDRKSGEKTTPPETETPGPPLSISKPMAPTELPKTPGTATMGGDDT